MKTYAYLKDVKEALTKQGINVSVFDTLDSTNTQLSKDINAHNAQVPALYIAKEQTKGKGRMTRSWFSSPESSICMTVARKIPADAAFAESFTIRAGCAICARLNELCGASLKLKWPNDIYTPEGKKVSGMLAELKCVSSSEFIVLLGIGLNVDFSPIGGVDALPKDIVKTCTDLASVSKKSLDKSQIISNVTEAILYAEDIVKNIPTLFEKLDWLKGKSVSVKEGDAIFTGIADGVNDRGNLILRLNDNSLHFVKSGEATLIKNF